MNNENQNFESLQHVRAYTEVMMQEDFIIDGITYNISNHGFRFDWLNSKKVFGRCTWNNVRTDRRIISMSKYLCKYNLDNREQIENTVLHEIAHAIVSIKGNIGVGHGPIWVRIAKQIGCDGKQFYSKKNVKNVFKWKHVCTTCGNEHGFHSKPKRERSCGKCSPVWNPKFKMELIQNY